MANEFMAAIQKARLRLTQIEAEQQRLAQEKAQLLKSIEALAPLLSEQPSRESLTLADSMRTVMAGYEMNRPGSDHRDGKAFAILVGVQDDRIAPRHVSSVP